MATRLQGTENVPAGDGLKWNLDDVLPARSGKLFQSAVLDRLEGMVSEFENERSSLNESISNETFVKLLRYYEEIARMRSRLGSYAYMFFSENTKSQDARRFKARAEEIEADAANRTLFFELWWKSLEDNRTDFLIQESGNFSYYLRRLLQTKKYTLQEAVEQAINLKDTTGRATLLQIYHQIRDSFQYEVETASGKKRVGEEQLRDLFHSSIRKERISAYTAMLSRIDENKDVLGEIYQSLLRDWRNEGIKLRKYATPISIRNISNDVSDKTVDILLETCRENRILFQRFFKTKSVVLGLSDFSRIDVYASLPLETEKTYTWAEASSLVLNTFKNFDSEFARLAERVFSEGHIDAEPREAKLGGAYCMGVTPSITPYVLLSFTGSPRSVATIAHELGHAVHGMLSSKLNNQLSWEAPLPLAETASVFAELLLTEKLLSTADKKAQKNLLFEFIDDSYATICRQAFFTLFEIDAHERVASGTTVGELSEAYLSNLKQQFGDGVAVPEYFRHEWLSIPHIYQSPFYCYAYAWGNLLVFALYRRYKEEGVASFAPRYMKMLSRGGSESPEKILAESGFDINSREFWQSGFDELGTFVSRLEDIL
jgi:oligoendopeptidase F